ncbi:DUF2147 domain-containing protein [Mucilaginibacter xinganensis]|uniref:DUF2147 domain-containing protein n=1 Tax=Mucilaginibacter xinganensis TaxID=1234841 RepID=A0A223NSG4_9SPHI|nr:DUF2147 domain-containing protein [Mucilaginibacter xinganensis]ASU32845.1 hypothetical protein MuYL_0945 [Mucilaginibacter xinganensis]
MKRGLLIAGMLFFYCAVALAQNSEGDKITGRWISEKKNLVVEVYKYGREYKGRIVWFSDLDRPNYPEKMFTDYKNPDTTLRKRKLIGMDVLRDLVYNKNTGCWEDGLVYDCRSGKEWNSCLRLSKDGILYLTGYWHLKFIGKTATFQRANLNQALTSLSK